MSSEQWEVGGERWEVGGGRWEVGGGLTEPRQRDSHRLVYNHRDVGLASAQVPGIGERRDSQGERQ